MRHTTIRIGVVALALLGLAGLTWLAGTPAAYALPRREPTLATALLYLAPVGAPAEAWAGVQWQGIDGVWHEVAGWQGALEDSGGQRWWVEPQDLGTGPFRWVVYTRAGGAVWGASAVFTLPVAVGETLTVSVSAPSKR